MDIKKRKFQEGKNSQMYEISQRSIKRQYNFCHIFPPGRVIGISVYGLRKCALSIASYQFMERRSMDWKQCPGSKPILSPGQMIQCEGCHDNILISYSVYDSGMQTELERDFFFLNLTNQKAVNIKISKTSLLKSWRDTQET